MMEVDKASAGSGKTYTLAHTYMDLLTDDLAYRHILAVTFTNKATAEMKERILRYLSEDPAQRRKLVKILHDYSAFSVSTIDRFFQRTLKAFAREIGQVADYQVELDRESLIDEAMDRILDSLTGDGSQEEVLGHRERGDKRELLVDEPDARRLRIANRAKRARRALVSNRSLVAAIWQNARQHVHQRRLACAVLAA